MDIIEGQTYERYAWDENGDEKYVYICVPITLLLITSGNKSQTHFILWN